MKIAFVFPGQGSQAVGMAAGTFTLEEAVKLVRFRAEAMQSAVQDAYPLLTKQPNR